MDYLRECVQMTQAKCDGGCGDSSDSCGGDGDSGDGDGGDSGDDDCGDSGGAEVMVVVLR